MARFLLWFGSVWAALGFLHAGEAVGAFGSARALPGAMMFAEVANVKDGPFSGIGDLGDKVKEKITDLLPTGVAEPIDVMLSKFGLENRDYRWLAFTLGEIRTDATNELPAVSCAVSFSHEIDTVVENIRSGFKTNRLNRVFLFETEVGTNRVWLVNGFPQPKGKKNLHPCLTSLGGELVIFASSIDMLSRQIALYGAEGEEDLVLKGPPVSRTRPFSMRTREIASLRKVGGLLGESFLADAERVWPNISAVVENLKTMNLTLAARGRGGVIVRCLLVLKDAKVAESFLADLEKRRNLVGLALGIRSLWDARSRAISAILNALRLSCRGTIVIGTLETTVDTLHQLER